MLLKVCGITSIDDALLVAESGADMLGLIFAETSKRRVSVADAAAISGRLRGRCKIVGVFQNQSAEFILATRETCNLDFVQLHGDEDVELARAVSPVIKAFTYDSGALPPLQEFSSVADFALIDRSKYSSDDRFLPNVIEALISAPPSFPFLIAGGINATNVYSTVTKLVTVPTFAGIDLASSVESAPGKKDAHMLQEFTKAFKEASHVASRR